jgi:hypothetical protein
MATAARIMATAAAVLVALLAASPGFAAPATADPAPADATDDLRYEQRDGISASAIEFEGVANSANARWLVSLYEEAFARPADLGGLDHWLARIAAGGDRSRLVVARSFLNSDEGSRNEAVLAYEELLGRQPDPQGLAFWTAFLRTGSVNTLRFQHLASDEYFENTGGTNRTYVEQLYRDLLDREIDPQGLAFYVGRLDDGTPAWWVSRSIYESPESLGNRVTAYYDAILGRSPTTNEIADGVDRILAEDERAVRAALLASDEAFDPFLTAVLTS